MKGVNKKTTIGLLAKIEDKANESGENFYAKAIELCGADALILPYVEDDGELDEILSKCDGFFFTGGADVFPGRYSENPKSTCGTVEHNRDEFEFRAFEKIIKTEKPMLGICRGMQLINVALGGTLHQDIPTEINTSISHRQSEPQLAPSHGVLIMSDTPLHYLIGEGRMTANSFHHQCVKALGKGLLPMAMADDGIIEAVYLDAKRYLRAYQWHPERLCRQSKENLLIFEDFIKACTV